MRASHAVPWPPSLYVETAPPAPETPVLDGDSRVSVAVIGGGYTGLSTALHLAERGVRTLVLEAQAPGWGASGRNGGQVNPGLKHDPDRIEADFGADLGRRMIALSGGAPDFVFDLVRRQQIACEAIQSGTLRVAATARAIAGLRVTGAQWNRFGAGLLTLDSDGAEAFTGSRGYGGALLDPRGGQLNPLAYARGLARAAIAAGVAVHGGSRVSRAWRDGGMWRLRTATGTVTAEKLVLATNGYTDDLWPGLRLGVVPVFSAIVASEPLPEAIARRITPQRAAVYEMGDITVYYRLDQQGRLLIGGRSVQREVGGPGDLRYLIDTAETLWPSLAGVAWTHGWSGQIAATTDHYPHVHEPDETVLVCLGYNGRGVAMSSAMGPELARRVVEGQGARFDMPVTGMRAIPFHALWKQAVQARVLYARIRDSLSL
jgi:glycine/D-amino acid oxidase-like deaminating enzyme